MNSRAILWVGLLCLVGGWPLVSNAQPLYFGSWGVSWPAGLALDEAGVLYVTSSSSGGGGHDGTLRTYTRDGALLRTVATGMNFPWGIAVASDGTMYVAEYLEGRVVILSPQGIVTGIIGPLSGPRYVILSRDGCLFVTDWSGILKFTTSGVFVSQWTIGGPSANLYGVVEDAQGNVYAADWENNCVWKCNATGVVVKQWGTFGSAPGQFWHPGGLAIDPEGRLYVSDGSNCRIQRFTLDGQFLDAFGSQGSGPGQLSATAGVVSGPWGETFVADRDNQRVCKFVDVATPTESTSWGRIKALYR